MKQNNNIFIGHQAMMNNTTGSYNTAIGHRAGFGFSGSSPTGVAKDNPWLYLLYGEIVKRKYPIISCKLDSKNQVHISYRSKWGKDQLILTPKGEQ